MSEYEVYWLTDFIGRTPRNNYGNLSKKQTNKYKDN